MNYLAQLPVRVLIANTWQTGEQIPVLVDGDYDGEYFAEYEWRVLPNGYVIRYNSHETVISEKTGIILASLNSPWTYLHHLILPRKKGYWRIHINGNRLDNRSCNIAYRTPSESAMLRPQWQHKMPKRPDSIDGSKYRGVRKTAYSKNGIIKTYSTWTVYCQSKYVGTFKTEVEAAKAYDKRAKEIWGDLAILNFPTPVVGTTKEEK